MNKIKYNYTATIIKISCAFLFIISSAGCTNETQTINGKVVDKSGNALSDVAVSACYSGWGWSSGYVVWDKNFCSEIILTNHNGSYIINFKGPKVMRLRVAKDGWIQAQDFNTKDSRIVLINTEEYSETQATETKLLEKRLHHRLPNESNEEFYCRVIISRIRPVDLDYHGEPLSIVPNLLQYNNLNNVLFTVRGSSKAASTFASEVVFRINGQAVKGNFSLRSVVTTCKSDIHFIEAKIPDVYLGKNKQIEILVPSVQALFDMQIWNHSIKP